MYKYIFGPVNSKRLGVSLGLDIVDKKICTFNCVYCEVGKTEKLTTERKSYVKASDVIREIDLFFKVNPDIHLNYITFAGHGEPTLNSELGLIIDHLKTKYPYPVCVLTNGSLLYLDEVKNDLLKADLVIPSLDAISKEAFKKINRPKSPIKVQQIIDGIKQFKQEFKGTLWLEVLFVKGINDEELEVNMLKEKVLEIKPDKVYVNSIYRPPADEHYCPVDEKLVSQFQKEFDQLLNQEEQVDQQKETQEKSISDKKISETELVELLKPILEIRPCTIEDISAVLVSYNYDLHEKELSELLNTLVEQGKILKKKFGQAYFYSM